MNVARILFVIAVVGSVTSFIYSSLVIIAALRFGARKRRADAAPPAYTPAISVLKPLHNAEPGLERNIESFFQQQYPAPFELLFCARHKSDAGLQIAQRLMERYPDVDARIITCGEPQYPNAKMWSLHTMARTAKYKEFISSDADARVAPDYLLRCVQALSPAHAVSGQPVDLGFCLYLGKTDGNSFFTELDVLGKGVEMASGCMVADMLSGTDFALGVTMILRPETFDVAGGYESLGQYWADDFVIGHRLAADGRVVEISPHVIRLMVADEGVRKSFHNQLRWVQSTRRSRPWGHFGTGLTFASPFALLGFAVEAATGHWLAAALFIAFGAHRMLQAAIVLHAMGSETVARQALLYPLRDLVGSVVWMCGYWPADSHYHGSRFRLTDDGRLVYQDGSHVSAKL